MIDHKQSRSGFTLIELVVVVAILAVLAAIVTPSVSMSDKRKLDTVQVSLQDALDHAQALAYHKGEPYGVKFHVVKQWFAVVNDKATAVEDPLSHGPYIVYLNRPGMPGNVEIESAQFNGRLTAGFNEKGILQYGGEVFIRGGETTRRLLINSATAKLVEASIEP
jgi:prepilin-type N-terminal cleavage/methylation domain-containing protein